MSRPFPLIRAPLIRAIGLTTALASLAACSTAALDWDLRRGGGLNTSGAALAATGNRPAPDDRGVLSYPGYQVAVARRDDTVTTVANRVGISPADLARYNAIQPDTLLRAGEVLALPNRVAAAPGVVMVPGASGNTGNVIGGPIQTQPLDVASVAGGAIDKATTSVPAAKPAAAKPAPTGQEPVQHRVQRGETAFIIARNYNVSAKALADWNGLGPDMALREGQFLMIPVALPNQPAKAEPLVTAPGSGSPTPVPPSAKAPLPAQNETPATAQKPAAGTPTSPDLGEQRTAASAAKFAMPLDGKIIRGYVKKKNDGIDIAASAGSPVRAASDGVVAAITKDTEQVPILVIKHSDGVLTVYAGIDGVTVAKGAAVKRGQTIASVRAADPAFLHFEVRKGFESVDPLPYLQ